MNRLRVAVQFGAALAVLLVLGYVVGLETILREVESADDAWLAVAVACSVGALTAWIANLYVLARAFDVLPARGFLAAYFEGLFARSVLPMANVGGVAVTGYALSRRSDDPFERTLAAAGTWEFLNVAGSATVAAAALVRLAAAGFVGPSLSGVVTTVVVVAVALVATASVVAYRSEWLVRGASVFTGLAERTPLVRRVVSPERVDQRVRTFFRSLDRAAENRIATAVALALGGAAWTCMGAAFYAALAAVGVTVPFSVAAFVVPVAGLAAVGPTPGGVGGVEAVQTAVLVLLVDVNVAAASAAVLLFRFATYWLHLAVAGVGAALAR